MFFKRDEEFTEVLLTNSGIMFNDRSILLIRYEDKQMKIAFHLVFRLGCNKSKNVKVERDVLTFMFYNN